MKGIYVEILIQKTFRGFNDYLECIFEPIKPARHSVITDDDLALEVIQNENWQYLIKAILPACKTNNGGINYIVDSSV